MTLRLENITVEYSPERVILKDFNLEIPKRSITCLLGPSGCGKTTLLHLMGGLIHQTQGQLVGFDQEIPACVFQETRILPWKTVLHNVTYTLRGKMSKTEATDLAVHFLDLMGLRSELSRYPHQLSGGMKQRVAIARAFAYPSSLILMDEAFQGLDLGLKQHILDRFKEIWQENRRTVVFVTHDVDEALMIGQEIMVLNGPPVSVSLKQKIAPGQMIEVRDKIVTTLRQ